MSDEQADRGGATPDQLRDDIDHGRTGDKVPDRDPAVAPLGTDEEAAGTPLDPDLVAETRRAEASRGPRKERVRGGGNRTLLFVLAAVAVIAFLAALMLWLS